MRASVWERVRERGEGVFFFSFIPTNDSVTEIRVAKQKQERERKREEEALQKHGRRVRDDEDDQKEGESCKRC